MPGMKRVMLHTGGAIQNEPPPKQVAGLDYPVTVIGKTAHVTVSVATALGIDGLTVGKDVLVSAENDFQHVNRLFGVFMPPCNIILSPLSTAHDGSGGAYHYGCDQTDLYCDVRSQPHINVWTTLALFVAELVEVASAQQGSGWNCGESNGEGISRAIAEAIHPNVLDGYSTVAVWLDNVRNNWVDQNNPTDRDSNSNGCSVLFLNWLHAVKGYTFTQICQAGAANLAGTYRLLAGSSNADAWGDFSRDVNAKWPVGMPSRTTKDQAW